MKRLVFLLMVMACVSVLFAGCGDDDDDNDDSASTDDDTDDDTGDDDAADDDVADDDATDDDTGDDDIEPPPGCDTLVDGLNTMVIDGLPRKFYLDLPDGVTEFYPWPVVFNWHGFGDTASNMRQLVAPYVNDPDFPFIGVTPEDSSMLLDWDIIDGADPMNRELRLFDAVLAEIDTCFGVDPDHIHTTGFSLGGAISDMLGVLRGDIIASIATYSGGYASDPANSFPYAIANWPELTTTNQYVEFRIHGGTLDWMIMPFGQYGENDGPYLNANGHDYIHCVHPYVHNMGPSYMGPQFVLGFFHDHPYGTTETPYVDGFPAGFKDTCEVLPKD